MPIENIIEFLLYIAPGYIALQLYRSYWPVEKKDSFHDIALSVIYGVTIITILKWTDRHWFNYHFESNLSGFPSAKFLFGILIFGVILGGLFIGQRELRSYLSKQAKFLKFLSPGNDAIWVKINDRTNKDWATVYLDDGSIYLGWISNYIYNPHQQDQDFLLSRAKRLYDNLEVMYEIDGCGIYLNTRDVKRIEFRSGSDS